MNAPGGLEPLEWTVRVPLLTNPIVLKQLLWWAGMTALLCGLIFGAIFVSQDGIETLPTVLIIMAAIFGGAITMAVLVMGLFFFNRMTLRYRLDGEGIHMATGDPKVKAANTAAIVLGILTRRPGAVGAGLMARSQEKDSVEWNDITRWRTFPRQYAVAAHRGFPGPLYVYAPREMFQMLVDRFAAMRPSLQV